MRRVDDSPTERITAALTLCDEFETYARQYPNVPPTQFVTAIRRVLTQQR